MGKIQIPLDLYSDLPQIIDSVSDSVMVFDTTPRVLMLNTAACDELQITAEEFIGKTPSQYVTEGYLDRSLINEVLRTGKEVSGILHTRSGREFVCRARPIFDEDGKVKLVVTTSSSLLELNNLRLRLDKELKQSKKYLEEINHLRKYVFADTGHVFSGKDMESLLDFVKKVAPLDCTVLITGESGVGKEVLAKTIHVNSARKHRPFIPVCIPAIPESLMEAELFGYREGAFTGSKRGGKIGLFEMAQGGTLFLDEIADIPYGIQVKILRAIDNHEITGVGETKSTKLDVRIIAATNKNLLDEIKKGLFREDLFYRLNVIPIVIHPLRERKSAIIPLAMTFLHASNLQYKVEKQFSIDALEELCTYAWPGNIRELKHVVERLTIFTDDPIISAGHVRKIIYDNDNKQTVAEQQPVESTTIRNKYESYEHEKILDALKQTGGNITQAARLIGMSRNKLYRRLAK